MVPPFLILMLGCTLWELDALFVPRRAEALSNGGGVGRASIACRRQPNAVVVGVASRLERHHGRGCNIRLVVASFGLRN
jgi:hypothetical protein